MKPLCKDSRHKFTAGFTIVELVVSIAIFTLIIGIVVLNQSRVSGTILVTNLAYDVALSIRQAQVYGVSVRAATDGNFGQAYGIHFEAPSPNATTDSYVLFSAIPNAVALNSVFYDEKNTVRDANQIPTGCVSNTPCLSFFQITRGNFVKEFCAVAAGVTYCNDSGQNNNINSLDISFLRPDPEAYISANSGAGQAWGFDSASIAVASPQGVTRTVTISHNGQISVK